MVRLKLLLLISFYSNKSLPLPQKLLIILALVGLSLASPIQFKTETALPSGSPHFSLYGEPILEPQAFFIPSAEIIAPPTLTEKFDTHSEELPIAPAATLIQPAAPPAIFTASIAVPELPKLPELFLATNEYGLPPAIEATKPLAIEEIIPEAPVEQYGPPPIISAALPAAEEQNPAEEYGPPPPVEILAPLPAPPALPELPQLPEVIIPIIPDKITGSLAVAQEITTLPPLPETTTTPAPVTTLPPPTGQYAPVGPVSHYGDPIVGPKKWL